MVNILAVIAKANARYQCQECGSTELIQAHHETPGDDNSLIVLCAECHSRRHPDVPRGLFFTLDKQPCWHNKSAASLAKEFGVHPRTIIRRARELDLLDQHNLSREDELKLRELICGSRSETSSSLFCFLPYRRHEGNPVRLSIMFNLETWDRLIDYIIRKYGRRRGMSMMVDTAVREYLDREEAKDAVQPTT